MNVIRTVAVRRHLSRTNAITVIYSKKITSKKNPNTKAMHNSNLENCRIANKPIHSLGTEQEERNHFSKEDSFLLINDYLFSICKPENLYF